MNALLLSFNLITSALATLTFIPPQTPAVGVRAPIGSAASVPSLRGPVEGDLETKMAAFSRNPDGFRQRASQDIEGYALAAQAMGGRCDEFRGYLKTRLQALREHVDYARAELVKLPSSEGDPDFTTAHARFHRTMTGLDEAFTQAMNELNDGA